MNIHLTIFFVNKSYAVLVGFVPTYRLQIVAIVYDKYQQCDYKYLVIHTNSLIQFLECSYIQNAALMQVLRIQTWNGILMLMFCNPNKYH